MDTLIKGTTKQEKEIAINSLSEFQAMFQAISKNKQSIQIKIKESKSFITLPINALLFLEAILKNMAGGKTISLIPSNSEVSSQKAAEMLNVSRPHLIKLLESGKIPFKKVGSHRRILIEDLMNYLNVIKKVREDQLDFLAQQAQELNLGYE